MIVNELPSLIISSCQFQLKQNKRTGGNGRKPGLAAPGIIKFQLVSPPFTGYQQSLTHCRNLEGGGHSASHIASE